MTLARAERRLRKFSRCDRASWRFAASGMTGAGELAQSGRAPGLQPGGRRFEPGILHHLAATFQIGPRRVGGLWFSSKGSGVRGGAPVPGV